MTGITNVDGGTVLSKADYADISEVVNRDNRVINGDFEIWQRGISFNPPTITPSINNTFSATYSADRWVTEIVNYSAAGVGNTSRQAFPLGYKLGVNSPRYFLRQTYNAYRFGANFRHYCLVSQRIEGVRSYAGQTVTVLGWARRSSGTGPMSVNISQNFGTGGTPSSTISSDGQLVNLSDTWAPFATTITLSDIAGKTLGTNGNDYIGINFWISAGGIQRPEVAIGVGNQTIGVDFWGIHIKRGIPTADVTEQYRPRDPDTELSACQRYYETGTSVLLASYTSGNFGGGISPVFFNAAKRKIPSVTAVRTGGAGGTTTLAVGVPTTSSAVMWFNGAATIGDYVTYAYYVDAEL